MRRPSLYSRSSGSRATRDPDRTTQPAPATQPQVAVPAEPIPRRKRFRTVLKRFERPLLVVAGAAVALALVITHASMQPKPREYTQKDIDKAVLHTLATKTLPSPEARAFENVRRSVVRV